MATATNHPTCSDCNRRAACVQLCDIPGRDYMLYLCPNCADLSGLAPVKLARGPVTAIMAHYNTMVVAAATGVTPYRMERIMLGCEGSKIDAMINNAAGYCGWLGM